MTTKISQIVPNTEPEDFCKEYKQKYQTKPLNIENATLWLKLTFNWARPYITFSNTTDLKEENLPTSCDWMKLEPSVEKFKINFSKIHKEHLSEIESTKFEPDDSKKPQILRKTIFQTFKFELLCMIFLQLITLFIDWLVPLIIYISIDAFKEFS